jgi:hypothetical protein
MCKRKEMRDSVERKVGNATVMYPGVLIFYCLYASKRLEKHKTFLHLCNLFFTERVHESNILWLLQMKYGWQISRKGKTFHLTCFTLIMPAMSEVRGVRRRTYSYVA